MALRDPASFQHHLEHTVAQCCTSWIVLQRDTLLGPELIITPKLCRSNYCPTCRSHNLHVLRQILARSIRDERWRLVTLTYPDHSADIEQTIAQSYSTFRKFIHRIRHAHPTLKYVRTIELHASGFPHFHTIVNKYIPVNHIEKSWRDVGGGNVDVRARRACPKCGTRGTCEHRHLSRNLSHYRAAGYLTEELEKKMQDPYKLGYLLWKYRVRTITTSRNIQLHPRQQPLKFIGIYPDLTTAMSNYEMLNSDAKIIGKPTLDYVMTNSAIIAGYGITSHYDTQ